MIWDDQRPDDSTGGALLAEPPIRPVTVPAQAFRETMSRLGAAVHVVTTAGPGGKAGFTATAVSPVSDQPEMLASSVWARANRSKRARHSSSKRLMG